MYWSQPFSCVIWRRGCVIVYLEGDAGISMLSGCPTMTWRLWDSSLSQSLNVLQMGPVNKSAMHICVCCQLITQFKIYTKITSIAAKKYQISHCSLNLIVRLVTIDCLIYTCSNWQKFLNKELISLKYYFFIKTSFLKHSFCFFIVLVLWVHQTGSLKFS